MILNQDYRIGRTADICWIQVPGFQFFYTVEISQLFRARIAVRESKLPVQMKLEIYRRLERVEAEYEVENEAVRRRQVLSLRVLAADRRSSAHVRAVVLVGLFMWLIWEMSLQPLVRELSPVFDK